MGGSEVLGCRPAKTVTRAARAISYVSAPTRRTERRMQRQLTTMSSPEP